MNLPVFKAREFVETQRESVAPPSQAGGPNFSSNGLSQVVQELDIYYDSPRTCFWAQNDRGGWIRIKSEDTKRWLAERGFRTERLKDERVSQVSSLLNAIQRSKDIDYADSLAGYKTGIYQINEHRILVRDSPKFIQAKPGEWRRLKGIIFNMLGSEQQLYLFGWLKIAIEALYNFKPRVGQALTIAGPKDCGKSLLQNLITEMLGNRSMKPHRYMSGETAFNSELFGAEHLIIEDEEASTDIRARRNFGTKIKDICANITHSCHPKNRQAIHLTPFWRLTISVNDEPENLMILPPIDESLADKLIILKAEKHPMPMPTCSDREREAFMATLRAELPHFIHFLVEWSIPDDLRSERYGVTHFQHPEILEAIGMLTPEARLLEVIDTVLFDSVASGSWEGTALELQRELTGEHSKVRREADKLFSFPLACGTYLGRLHKQHEGRFSSEHTRNGNRWTIDPPSFDA